MPRIFARTAGSEPDQRGFSTFIAIAAFVVLGIVFLSIFLFSISGKPPASTGTQQNATEKSKEAATTSNEPPFIRIPENSLIYNNPTYKFMFAYPDSFGKLTESTPSGDTVIYQVESALAVKKPVGIGTALMDGRLGAYVYKKDTFKIIVGAGQTFVAPTKTGDDITWKVVSRDTTSNTDVSIGDAYPVKSSKSQTGIKVFDFARTKDGRLYGRWVLETGDHFVILTLPSVAKPSGDALTEQDVAAYKIIGDNMAKTVRLPEESSTGSGTESSSTTTTPKTTSPSPTPSNGGQSSGSGFTQQ